MLNNISSLVSTLNKSEQQTINGGAHNTVLDFKLV